jgi:hypothetical protein
LKKNIHIVERKKETEEFSSIYLYKTGTMIEREEDN